MACILISFLDLVQYYLVFAVRIIKVLFMIITAAITGIVRAIIAAPFMGIIAIIIFYLFFLEAICS